MHLHTRFSLEFSLVEAFEKIASAIAKDFGFHYQHTCYVGFYYLHLYYIHYNFLIYAN